MDELLDEGALADQIPVERLDRRRPPGRADPFEIDHGIFGEKEVDGIEFLLVHRDVIVKSKILDRRSVGKIGNG